jgi:protein tyrosine phosphatase (PTP) superfamily phosphohydrolase (DUF442 family)
MTKSKPALENITNFLVINDNLGTAGMPEPEQIKDIANAGYQLVINLALDESPGAILDEGEILAGHGIAYVHIPVIWENPDLASLKKFFKTMDEYRSRKVLVHCVLNMRVSVFVYLYRLIRLSESPEVAYASVLEIWEPDTTWQQFIHKAILAYAT